jgi:hypothetical protein
MVVAMGWFRPYSFFRMRNLPLRRDLLGDRTILHACTASRAQIQLDRAGAFANLDLEVTRGSIDLFQIRVGDQLDVQMPADLDEDGGDDSHRAVIGGEGLVQLGHDPANGRGFLKQVDVVSGIGQVQRGLHAGDTAADDQHGAGDIISHGFAFPMVKSTHKKPPICPFNA